MSGRVCERGVAIRADALSCYLVFSMALERKILAGVTVMYMMDRHATLYGTEAETLLVWEARYTSAQRGKTR